MKQQANQLNKKPDQRLGRSGEVQPCGYRREISGSCGALLGVANKVISQRLNSQDAWIRSDALHNFGDR